MLKRPVGSRCICHCAVYRMDVYIVLSIASSTTDQALFCGISAAAAAAAATVVAPFHKE